MKSITLMLISVAVFFSATSIHAKRMYKYVDENGILHFTDRRPKTDLPVEERLLRVENRQMVTLRQQGSDDDKQFFFFNHFHGPVEIEVTLTEATNIAPEPALPRRFVVQDHGERSLFKVVPANPKMGWQYALQFRAVPGDPAAQPQQHRYRYPFLANQRFYIGQGFGGSATHTDPQSYYALDIAMPEGTPVLAARDGVVMHTEEDFYGAGVDLDRYATRANMVRILHSDGTMAIYAHLQLESVNVKAGQPILTGERIGLSGNTGYSTGPHLHFSIQRNTGMQLESIPFRFANGNPEGLQPKTGTWLGQP